MRVHGGNMEIRGKEEGSRVIPGIAYRVIL